MKKRIKTSSANTCRAAKCCNTNQDCSTWDFFGPCKPQNMCQFDFLFGCGTFGFSHLRLSLRLCRCSPFGGCWCWSPIAIALALDVVLLRRPANTRFCMTGKPFFWNDRTVPWNMHIFNIVLQVSILISRYICFFSSSFDQRTGCGPDFVLYGKSFATPKQKGKSKKNIGLILSSNLHHISRASFFEVSTWK